MQIPTRTGTTLHRMCTICTAAYIRDAALEQFNNECAELVADGYIPIANLEFTIADHQYIFTQQFGSFTQ